MGKQEVTLLKDYIGIAKHLNAKKQKKIKHWKIIAFYLLVYDVVTVNFSYFFGLWLRFD